MRAVLTYHSLDDSGSVISISPAQFRRHLEWLARSRVRVCTLEQLVQESSSSTRSTSDGHSVALTFDDGFANFASVAWPLLREHGFPSTLFVVPRRVGRDNRWTSIPDAGIPILPLLDWDALGGLVGDGVAIGAHTRTHPHLPQLGEAQMEDEIVGSADDIAAHTGARPVSFAYPYGAVNATAGRIAARAFRVACTTEFRTLNARTVSSLVPRLDSYYFREPGQLRDWDSLMFRTRLRLRGGLRRVRQLLS